MKPHGQTHGLPTPYTLAGGHKVQAHDEEGGTIEEGEERGRPQSKDRSKITTRSGGGDSNGSKSSNGRQQQQVDHVEVGEDEGKVTLGKGKGEGNGAGQSRSGILNGWFGFG